MIVSYIDIRLLLYYHKFNICYFNNGGKQGNGHYSFTHYTEVKTTYCRIFENV